MSEAKPRHRRPPYVLDRFLYEQAGKVRHIEDHWLDGHIDKYNAHEVRFRGKRYESRVGAYIIYDKYLPYLMSIEYQRDQVPTFTRVQQFGNRLYVDGGPAHKVGNVLVPSPRIQALISQGGNLEEAGFLTETHFARVQRMGQSGNFNLEIYSRNPDTSTTADSEHRDGMLVFDPENDEVTCDMRLNDQAYRLQLPLRYRRVITDMISFTLQEPRIWEFPAEVSPLDALGVYFHCVD